MIQQSKAQALETDCRALSPDPATYPGGPLGRQADHSVPYSSSVKCRSQRTALLSECADLVTSRGSFRWPLAAAAALTGWLLDEQFLSEG